MLTTSDVLNQKIQDILNDENYIIRYLQYKHNKLIISNNKHTAKGMLIIHKTYGPPTDIVFALPCDAFSLTITIIMDNVFLEYDTNMKKSSLFIYEVINDEYMKEINSLMSSICDVFNEGTFNVITYLFKNTKTFQNYSNIYTSTSMIQKNTIIYKLFTLLQHTLVKMIGC